MPKALLDKFNDLDDAMVAQQKRIADAQKAVSAASEGHRELIDKYSEIYRIKKREVSGKIKAAARVRTD